MLTSRLDADALAAMNHALRRVVGASIRYFAVDSRLFPIDGENTGIFYAPSKLSDHRVLELRDGRTVPRDFFDIIAQTQRGAVALQDVRETDQVSDLSLRYKDMFYNSMFYRAYVGFSPQVAGQSCNDCIPGLQSRTNQQIANIPPMQAWNLSHFRLVYKTGYYNPFPPAEIVNHTDAWRAMEFTEAQELQGKINRGEATGVVDLSPGSTIRRGIVFVKYYDGAFLNGTVDLQGKPWPGVRVTVHDEFNVPHDTVLTDADGRYSVVVPFGRLHIAYSLGTPDNRSLTGPTMVHEIQMTVSDAAAMRQDVDGDGDGIVDWLIVRDVSIPGEALEGRLFADVDGNGLRGAGEPLVGDADVTLSRSDLGLTRAARTDFDGRFRIEALYRGTYDGTASWRGRTLPLGNVTIETNQAPKDLAIPATRLEGQVFNAEGRLAAGARITLRDLTNGTSFRATAAEDATFEFPGLLRGEFELVAIRGVEQSIPSRVAVPGGTEPVFHNATMYPTANVTGRTTRGGAPEGFVTLAFEQRSGLRLVRVATSDALGRMVLALPEGTWDVHGRHYASSALLAFVGSFEIAAGESGTFTASLVPGAVVGGRVFNAANPSETQGLVDVVFRGPSGQHRVRTDLTGRYLTYLPLGTWTVQVSHLDFAFLATKAITGDAMIDLPLPRGAQLRGTVLRNLFTNGSVSIEDPVRDATLQFSDGTRTFEALSGVDGTYAIALPTAGRFALRITRPGF